MYRKLLISLWLVAACSCSSDKSDDTNGNNGGGTGTGNQPGYVDTKIYVDTPAAIAALTSLKGGDTVVLRSGTYNSATISVNAKGNEQSPVVVMGAKPGSVTLTGASSLKIGGSYVVVRDLCFKNVRSTGSAIIELRINSSNLASNCRVTNCAIIDTDNNENKTTDYKWVSLYGESNTVDHCRFTNKTNMGTLMVVWLGNNGRGLHKIANNYFSRPTPILEGGSEVNGQETIRIGDSGSSMQQADCTVENNHFYRCNGEMEVISNKSCGNLYRANLLEECVGALTLRHGNGCIVDGNFFLGNNISNTGGVRIIGENHTVRNNYFEKIKGSGYRTAICLIRGQLDSPLSGYFQVKNALVQANTMVDCAYAIHVNYGDSKLTLPVISTTIKDNIVSSASSSNTAVLYIASPAPQVTWSGNTMYNARFTNITQQEVAASTAKPTITSREAACAAIRTASGVNWTIN